MNVFPYMGTLRCVPMSIQQPLQPLLQRYQRQLQTGKTDDPAQRTALQQLAKLQQQLTDNKHHGQGLYLWGPVGRGKTFLMDLFCESMREDCDQDKILRLHFHRFMEMIHQQLNQLCGHEDPLTEIAQQLAGQYKLLCFDEFLVAEIGDAMILGRLITQLFAQGVVLVSTSNRPPEELYRGDIHKDRFEPAVRQLYTHMDVIEMSGNTDHRHRQLTYQQAYFIEDEQALIRLFSQLCPTPAEINPSLKVCNRTVPCRALSDKIVWFNFDALCEGPRSHLDYVEIARRFHTVFLSHVPPLGGKQVERIKARGTEDGAVGSQSTGERRVMIGQSDDPARRFIALVDELYDRHVNLYLNADCDLQTLYQGDLLTFEFERTRSRLTEMASAEYQSTQHLP